MVKSKWHAPLNRDCSLLRVYANLTWPLGQHSCERRLLPVRWLPQPKRIDQTAQVRTFKGLPPGAIIAKNRLLPAILSQSVFFSVGVRSLRQISRRPAKPYVN